MPNLKPLGSAGLGEAARLHGVVNSLYALISVTICVPARAGERELLGFIPGGEHRALLILCVLETAPGQSRTASLALGAVVPASSGNGWTCQVYRTGTSRKAAGRVQE